MPLRVFRRREALAILFGAIPFAPTVAASPAPNCAERRYRADAVISLLNVPLYSRAGVGSGFARIETAPGSAGRIRKLAFAAGSWPERAAGLNRLGYIREEVIEQEDSPASATYLGCMTSSPEQTLAEAKNSLDAAAGEVAFSAIRGNIQPGRIEVSAARFHTSPNVNWSNPTPLWRKLEAAFSNPPDGEVRRESRRLNPDQPLPCPFLRTLLRAMELAEDSAELRFVYGLREYRLLAAKSVDPRMGRRMAERGLLSEPARLCLLRGEIHNATDASRTHFRLWFEKHHDLPLPLRFELKPRRFLSLIFEADPQVPPLTLTS